MPRHILIADGPALPDPTAIDTFWAEARKQVPGLGEDYQVRSLGIDAETTTQILEYIKTRDKVATLACPGSSRRTVSPTLNPVRPSCSVTTLAPLISSCGSPMCAKQRFGEIGYAESSLDGPPVQDPEVWIPLHRKYWNGLLAAYGRECTDDMPVLIEPFDYIGEIT